MRNLHSLDHLRVRSGPFIQRMGWAGDGTCGAFVMPSPIDNAALYVIAAVGGGWDHVSVSRRNRCPNWQEMEAVRRLFFLDDETAMQLHVPPADHINCHPHCLHMWRPNDGREIPRPPALMVAPGDAQAHELGAPQA